MAGISYLAKSAIAALLVVVPIGDTTVLLLFSLCLESLLTLMLIHERRWRRGATTQDSGGDAEEISFSALRRTAPHLRARRPAPSHGFVMPQASSARWRTASGEATS